MTLSISVILTGILGFIVAMAILSMMGVNVVPFLIMGAALVVILAVVQFVRHPVVVGATLVIGGMIALFAAGAI